MYNDNIETGLTDLVIVVIGQTDNITTDLSVLMASILILIVDVSFGK